MAFRPQKMAGPLSRRLCPSISRNNEKKRTPLPPCQFFLNGCDSHFVLMDSSQKLIRSSEIPKEQDYISPGAPAPN